jgi:DNA-binding transcriptional LysR family regulator
MEFKQLEILVAVAEEKSVLRAAARVFRTQPAVSMALAKLEREIGSCLFHRSRERRFHLTKAGEVLHAYAKRMLALRDEAAEVVMKRVVACSQDSNTVN